jgi:hypothetical protein
MAIVIRKEYADKRRLGKICERKWILTIRYRRRGQRSTIDIKVEKQAAQKVVHIKN